MTDGITAREFHESAGRRRLAGAVRRGLHPLFRTGSFAKGVAALSRRDRPAGRRGHADVDLRYNGVTVRLITSPPTATASARATSTPPARYRRRRGRWGPRRPAAVQTLLVVPGALVSAEVMPFWRAVLGYEQRPDSPDEDLVDPHDRGRVVLVRGDGRAAAGDAAEDPRGHLAAPRTNRGAHRGGSCRRWPHRAATISLPLWWTLADAEGNESDIATWVGRD